MLENHTPNPIESPIENTIESVSEHTAREKLSTLLDPEFRDFAIRFVNFAEYQEIMQEGKLVGREVHSPKYLLPEDGGQSPSPSFSEYVEKCKQEGWATTMQVRTDWYGDRSMSVYDELLNKLNEARKGIDREHISKEEYDAAVAKQFHDGLVAEIATEKEKDSRNNGWPRYAEPPEDIDFRYDIYIAVSKIPTLKASIAASEESLRLMVQKEDVPIIESILKLTSFGEISDFLDTLTIDAPLKEKILLTALSIKNSKMELSEYSEQDIEIVQNWLNDPTSVDTRLFINTVSNNQKHPYEPRQYNLALVFDSKIIHNENNNKARGWANIVHGESTEHILGAISIMGDKSWAAQMIDLSEKGGTSAHPIFDNKGNIKFPKTPKE